MTVRRGPAHRIRPSNRGIASRRSTIAACAGPLPRYIPETKNDVPGDSCPRGGGSPRAMDGGITCGTLLATMVASASGRHDATKMWGDHLVNKPVGETAMKTISSRLIGAYFTHQWGSRKDRGVTRGAVPASRVSTYRVLGLRALRVLERLSRRAAIGRQRCSPSFSSPGWVRLFVPDSVTPIRLRPCRVVSIAPGQYWRRPD